MQIRLGGLGEVEIDHDIDRLDIDTAGEQIRAHEMSGRPVAELVEDSISVWLLHLGVDVETAVPQLRNFLREQLYAVHRVAEDNTLVDIELGKEGIQAVHFLLLLYESIVLRNTLQGQFIHQINHVCVWQKLLLETPDHDRERSGKQTNLTIWFAFADQRLEDFLKLGGQQLVRLVHHDNLAVGKICHPLLSQVENSAGGGHNDVHGRIQAHNIVT
mmetsp:Transcript_16597/g.28097  ORF Transcript_16597/g.28097 Transcript_16597/m.28097 type:complete len:216 (-) Transcript_16597:577-1224(-)